MCWSHSFSLWSLAKVMLLSFDNNIFTRRASFDFRKNT